MLSFFVDELTIDGSPRRHEGNLHIPEEARLACDLLNELIWFYVIDQPALATQQSGQATIIRQLFQAYMHGGERLLPENRREELTEHSDLLRCISDHIASMTESQAIALHRRLYGADAVGILAPIWAT
jgi:dGTPase